MMLPQEKRECLNNNNDGDPGKNESEIFYKAIEERFTYFQQHGGSGRRRGGGGGGGDQERPAIMIGKKEARLNCRLRARAVVCSKCQEACTEEGKVAKATTRLEKQRNYNNNNNNNNNNNKPSSSAVRSLITAEGEGGGCSPTVEGSSTRIENSPRPIYEPKWKWRTGNAAAAVATSSSPGTAVGDEEKKLSLRSAAIQKAVYAPIVVAPALIRGDKVQSRRKRDSSSETSSPVKKGKFNKGGKGEGTSSTTEPKLERLKTKAELKEKYDPKVEGNAASVKQEGINVKMKVQLNVKGFSKSTADKVKESKADKNESSKSTDKEFKSTDKKKDGRLPDKRKESVNKESKADKKRKSSDEGRKWISPDDKECKWDKDWKCPDKRVGAEGDKMVLRKKRSAGSMEDLWHESILEEQGGGTPPPLEESSPVLYAKMEEKVPLLKISLGVKGKRAAAVVKTDASGGCNGGGSDGDSDEEERRVRKKAARAAKKAAKKAKRMKNGGDAEEGGNGDGDGGQREKLSLSLRRLSGNAYTTQKTVGNDGDDADSDSDNCNKERPLFPDVGGKVVETSVKGDANSYTNADGVTINKDDVVWGKVRGIPWWPAKVVTFKVSDADQCTKYAKVAWFASTKLTLINCDYIRPFAEKLHLKAKQCDRRYAESLQEAIEEAKKKPAKTSKRGKTA